MFGLILEVEVGIYRDDQRYTWDAPTPIPDDDQRYMWNEATTNWILEE